MVSPPSPVPAAAEETSVVEGGVEVASTGGVDSCGQEATRSVCENDIVVEGRESEQSLY